MRTLVVLTLLSGVLLAGCNTVAGVGRDMSAVGDAITDASNDAAKPSGSKARSNRAQSAKAAPSGQPGARQP